MRRTWTIGLVVAGIGVLGACDVVSAALALFSQIDLMGVVPAAGFSDPSSVDFGRVTFAIAGRDDLGAALAPALDELEVVSDDGTVVSRDGGEEVPGTDLGSFQLVADGSGSTEADLYCDGCPTDPQRIRVEAVRALTRDLGTCGAWRMSLVEFGREPYPPPRPNHVVADWTTDGEAVAAAADQLSSGWTTPLWDAVIQAVDAVDTDHSTGFTDRDGAGRGLVIVSDGVDTASSHSFEDAVAAAKAVGLPVHTIGFGPASDSNGAPDDLAVQGLRRLAEETGGTYGYVTEVDDLPNVTAAISAGLCGGYTKIDVVYDDPPPSGTPLTGFVRLKSNPEFGVPFLFRAP